MWHFGISDPYFFGNDESGIMNALTYLQTCPSKTALYIKYHSEKLANIIWRNTIQFWSASTVGGKLDCSYLYIKIV
jgi:hypothetical protein